MLKMEKGYYGMQQWSEAKPLRVTIHAKNGKGLLQYENKRVGRQDSLSQSMLKMEKGYYCKGGTFAKDRRFLSQSMLKMEKGYYGINNLFSSKSIIVTIHAKNGKGLLRFRMS